MLRKQNIMLVAILVVMILTGPAAAWAATPPLPAVLDLGVRALISETATQIIANYKELVVISGEPILANGTVEIRKGRPRNNQMSTTYAYNIENKQHELKLSRRLTVVTTWEQQGKEIKSKHEVNRFNETIRLGRRQYKLDSKRSQLDFSNVTLCEPAVSYFAGNMEGCKVYTIGRNEGEVMVKTTSSSTGYSQPWGQVETLTSYGTISGEQINEAGEIISWEGTVNSQIAQTTKVVLEYIPNKPQEISFPGGYLQTETEEGIIKVDYNLPRLDEEGIPVGTRRRVGEQTINLTGAAKTERLSVPQFSDIRGRWSEKDAILMGSLGAWETGGQYFHPTAAVNRREFALAVAKALRLEPRELAGELEENPYRDLSVRDADWPYLKTITERGIMHGVASGYFGPQGKITRAQAVTALIRALGFENLGPGCGYHTGFVDDGDIPSWAKNSFIVASQIGLIAGDTFNRARPGAYLTREEAATILAQLINYLRSDILRDYRDRILLYH